MKKYDIPISDEQKESLLTMVKHNLFNYNAKLIETEEYDLIKEYTNFNDDHVNEKHARMAYTVYNNSDIKSSIRYKCNNKDILIVSYHNSWTMRYEVPDFIFIPNFITKLLYKKRIDKFYKYAQDNSNDEYDLRMSHSGYNFIYAMYNSKLPTYEISVLDFPDKDYYTNIQINEKEYAEIMGGLVASYSREKLAETTELKKIFENSLKIS